MTLLDYLETEFASFEEKPFCELDAAVFTQLAMVKIELPLCESGAYALDADGVLIDRESPHEHLHISLLELLKAEFFSDMFTGLAAPEVKDCFILAAMNRRFRDVVITNYQSVFSAEQATQFAAMSFENNQFCFIAYRGTDTSLIGWREDFDIAAFNPVPAQALGLNFALRGLSNAPEKPLYIGGHSKGGNIAEYVALSAPQDLREKLSLVYSFDGPGFKQDAFTPDQFAAIAPLFVKYVPQDSIIGMALDSLSAYTVVRSTEMGIMQHDVFSWQIDGEKFQRRDSLSPAALSFSSALEQWVHSYSEQEIEEFTDALFEALKDFDSFAWDKFFGAGVQPIRYLRTIARQLDSQRAATLKRFASDLADCLRAAAANQANNTISSAREQIENTFDAMKSSFDKNNEKGLALGEEEPEK